jgi:DNA-binding IscR family transcriptional regulator
VLKGVRGPRGGYELARERRRLSVGDIVRAALGADDEDDKQNSRLVHSVIEPLVADASETFLAALDKISVDDLCRRAEEQAVFKPANANSDFTI